LDGRPTGASGPTVDESAPTSAREKSSISCWRGIIERSRAISVNRHAAELAVALRRDGAILNLGFALGLLGETLIDAAGKPTPTEVVAERGTAKHPFGAA
jgi:hypothetical protein